VELIASGRTAEVFAWGEGRVLKLDRPEWNGLAAMEASALAIVTAAGGPASRPYEMVMVDDRHGLVLERIGGPMLREVIASASDLDALASTWAGMHASLNSRVVPGLPDLVSSIGDGIRSSGLVPGVVDELVALLSELDDRRFNDWLRVVAAARLAEGFDGEHAEYLTALATGMRGR
jgi:hypothetical protein